MISFAVYLGGKPAEKINLAGAYVIGTDDVPLRAELSFKNGVISCKKRAAGPAGLALLWDVEGVGSILLETIRVQERDKPYVLQVELARGRLMRIANKLEDWGFYDFDGTGELLARVDAAREHLIQALQADEPAKSAEIGERALAAAVRCGEELSRFHAATLIARKRQGGASSKRVFGCTIPPEKPTEIGRKRMTAAFDFAVLPVVWRMIEPTEQTFQWKTLDAWVEALSRPSGGLPLRGSPLLAFTESHVPDWLYIWEHDFDTIRDLAFEHIRRVIHRYGQHVHSWTVVSGIHAPTCFAFSFEQLMELTRMAAALVKQTSPRGTALIEIVSPFGEYYARNQRTIPPLLYADMVLQSGVNFDAFGLKFRFGPASDGSLVRDMFALSSLLDQFSKLGKPIHVTGVEVPSVPGDSGGEGRGENQDAPAGASGGFWRQPWNESVQATWLRAFYEVVLSKPFVESVCWGDLWDAPPSAKEDLGGTASGGLLRSDLSPKESYKKLLEMRQEWTGIPAVKA